ncbi:hypothetical protein DL93DRAFT_2072794 [Clavulina sp. PMI_390]|nr:hypothetical protein DL93DRAFT_2072794 [Clavulina sp. PMI_390]
MASTSSSASPGPAGPSTASSSTTQPTPSATPTNGKKPPMVIIALGLAGSGKTTFIQRLNSYLHSENTPPYIVNLDPAVSYLPFDANIDIRDTVNYEEVMKQYNLGPNGGIMTSLNLFTTKFDQVLTLIEKRADTVDYVILDTPGQIEIFTWSASGAIITDAVAASLPTVVAYIIDTPRTTAPATFMSNMLYACSILYKTKLPFILVFNKTDVEPHAFALEWMQDFEAFQRALLEHGAQKGQGGYGDGEPSYMDSLMNSMSLVLDEFYRHLTAVGVSAMTGEGMKEFFEAVDKARAEYETDYKPEHDRLMAQRQSALDEFRQANVNKMMKDLSVDKKFKEPWTGPGRDPREDKFADDDGDQEMAVDDDDDAEDSGEDIDRRDTDEGIPFDMERARHGNKPIGSDVKWQRPM